MALAIRVDRSVPAFRLLGAGWRLWLIVTVSLATTILAAIAWPGRRPPEYPICLWRSVTGIPCPGCGLGHATFYFLRGAWREAWRWHPLVFWLGAQAALLWLGLTGLAWTRRAVRLPQRAIDLWLLVNVLAMLGHWGARLALRRGI